VSRHLHMTSITVTNGFLWCTELQVFYNFDWPIRSCREQV